MIMQATREYLAASSAAVRQSADTAAALQWEAEAMGRMSQMGYMK